jgi:aspartate/methionine/tyrosine aminotransferase
VLLSKRENFMEIINKPDKEQIKNNIQQFLESHDQEKSELWAELIVEKPIHMRIGIIQKLVPNAFLSENAKNLHEQLANHYPELLKIIEGTTAYFTAFPKTGIPAQAFAIAKHVKPAYNAGIGIAKTYDGDIMINPEFKKVFDLLKPEKIEDEDWRKLRNSVFKYNNGLGAPWYREIAFQRYLNDGKHDTVALNALKKALRIKPVPVYGGTVGLTIALETGVGEECPLVLPKTYWGNVNLKMSHGKCIKEVCDYIDSDGKIHPDILWKTLEKLKANGHKKAAIYFNFPHNPTGIVPTREQAVELEDVVQNTATKGFQLVVICDEPYYPFVRGEDAIKVPFSYYMKPGDNRNILTFVSINGTKRDGMYGMRHSDLLILTPLGISDEGINHLEKTLLGGYMRGSFSFSCALNQYLLARAITDDPLIAIKPIDQIKIDHKFFDAEKNLVDYIETSVNDTLDALGSIDGLVKIEGYEKFDSYGGFFVTYKLSDELQKLGITAVDLHKAGLKKNCGIIATNGFIRISGLVSKDNDKQFAINLQETIEYAKKVKVQQGFNESMF